MCHWPTQLGDSYSLSFLRASESGDASSSTVGCRYASSVTSNQGIQCVMQLYYDLAPSGDNIMATIFL